MPLSSLEELFKHFLRDMYYAEKKILKTLPKMASKAESSDLKKAFESHRKETESHIANLEKVFAALDLKPRGVTCEAINGILKEGQDIIDEADKGEVRDSGMIAAAQAVEHYEIGRYGTLVAWARMLKMPAAAKALQANLDQEYAADKTLSQIAESSLNRKAA